MCLIEGRKNKIKKSIPGRRWKFGGIFTFWASRYDDMTNHNVNNIFKNANVHVENEYFCVQPQNLLYKAF